MDKYVININKKNMLINKMKNKNVKKGGSSISDNISKLVKPDTYIALSKQAQNKVKGGSISSDQVTSLVTPNTYKMLSAQNKIKGGSISSDRVTSLITQNTYDMLSNETQSALDGGSSKKCNTCNKKKCDCKNKVVKNKRILIKKGGMPTVNSGNKNIKHISELFDETYYKINNKSGGTADKTIGLDYSGIKSTINEPKLYSRGLSPITTKILANNAYQSPPAMIKETQYGSIYDGKDNKFSYNQIKETKTGGKKKK